MSSSLQSETLSADNSIYCNFCCSLKSASVVLGFSEVGRYLVIQLKHFASHDNQVIKDIKHVQWTPYISMLVKDNKMTYQEDYDLTATINHIGNLNRGHYSSFIKMPNLKLWLRWCCCSESNKNKVNNTSSYIYSYPH